ncbi:diguanylate cyclase [Arenimonas sp.]|uniref:diguanylate cyclase n=1 Tax=Arenimonas sp. TaxID=1872635 RepID=UPI0035AF3121
MATPKPAVPTLPEARRSPLWFGLLLFLAALAGSVWFVGKLTAFGESLEKRHGLAIVSTAAALLDAGSIASLRGHPDDAGTATHEHVRVQLAKLHQANPGFRFVYLMRPVDSGAQSFLFLADAEDPESPDYSAPGDVYSGPSENLRLLVNTEQPVFSGVVEDEWGTWVSALAPIHHEGRLVALLGVDLAQEDWLSARERYRGMALLISGLVLALIALFLLGLELQRRAGLRTAALGQVLSERLAELYRAQEGQRLADVVVRHTSEAIMVLDPQLRILRVNPAYEKLSGRRAEDVIGRVPPALTLDPGLQARVEAAIAAGDHWQEEIWALRDDGSQYPVGALAEVVRDDAGDIEHFVVVLQDVSAQKELEERLRELSATDGLTRIANRRSFDEGLVREWERSIRQGCELSVIMADIDFFKRYNDHYGHVAGDACLQQVAAALKAGVRQGGDLVARYGGEEFAVILPGADAAAALAVAEALRRRVEELALPHVGNEATGVVTISLGVATIRPSHEVAPTTLVEKADQQLYRAKAGGRNRVEA